jgi:hypothetical protein
MLLIIAVKKANMLITLLLILPVVWYFVRKLLQDYKKKNKFPKYYTPYNEVESSRKPSIKPNRDRYKQDKVPEDIDVIVIGSGISGLATAAFLSCI